VRDCSLALVFHGFPVGDRSRWRWFSKHRIDDFLDVRNLTKRFFTYHGFLTITTSSRIISRDYGQP
jgi:hypothetical protein